MALNNNSPRWYQTGWGVALMGFGALCIAVIVWVVVLTAQYWWQIKHGGVAAPAPQALGFSASLPAAAAPSVADRSEIEAAAAPYRGRPTAPTVIVEFVDFKCPNCQTAAPIMRQVVDQFGYKIKFIVRHFPAESLHPGATQLAEFAWCAGEQDAFWPVHDWLFTNQDQLPPQPLTQEQLANLVSLNNLDANKFFACFGAPATAEKVQNDYLTGIRLGVRGTPTFFVNGTKIEGVVPFSRWQTFLDSAGVK